MLRILFVLLMFPLLALAQLSVLVENESGYTGNAFANYTEAGDYYTSLGLQINHDWLQEHSGFRLFAQSELETFKQYRDRSQQQHSIGAAYYHSDPAAAFRLQAGVIGQQRYHSESYSWYEQQQVSAYVNGRWIMFPSLYLYLGSNLKYTHYPRLSAFSYWQPSGFARLGWFSSGGTTLLVEANLLSKQYLYEGSFTAPAEMVEMVTLGQRSSLQGVFSLKVARALGKATGASLEVMRRHNFVTSVRYLGNGDGTYYSDEELFDDVFGYHGYSLMPSIKHLLSKSWTLQVGSTWLWKDYDRRLAVQLDGEPYADGRLREDQRTSLWFSLEKKMSVVKNWQPLILTAGYRYMHNRSNDPYYQYRSDFFTLGVSTDF